MEGLSLDNIMSGEDIENLFIDVEETDTGTSVEDGSEIEKKENHSH